MTTTVGHWINNKEVPSTSGRTAPVYDPALGVESKRVALANGAEISAAIASAKAAFPEWSKSY
jgi:malonate-semialdehyde dehydrogenase (acetylating) / methylmalonate-semialdehyde dehydrogenase